jgi:hypothetical protein
MYATLNSSLYNQFGAAIDMLESGSVMAILKEPYRITNPEGF